jgi:surface antigen
VTRTRPLGTALLVTVVLLALLPFTPPAAAASRYLCTGYVSCKADGYPHFGYRKASSKMWWRMFSGHNCTNYVAYRLVKGGMSAERPWSGTGMAYNWGRANRRITDRTPMVGSVAWWNAGDGVGSSGHVAFVERVVSADKIVISEDSWSGDFHWRTITRSGGSWPTGFVHFDDREVQMTTRPAITGDAAIGSTLTASPGRWTPAADLSFQWLADGQPVAGATAATLTPTLALRGKELSVRVSATSPGYVAGSATSPSTGPVVRGTLTTTAAPVVTGTARVDELLEVRPAAWSPAPDRTAIRWYADGKPIPGATGRRLRLDQAQIRQRITVRMVARTEGYKVAAAVSDPTAAVAAGLIEVTRPFTLSGAPRMGRRLAVTAGTYDPAGAEVTYAWLRNGERIPGATGLTHTLGVADVGRRITVQVTLRHPGYRDKTLLLAAPGPVTTAPSLRLAAVGKPRRAVVRMRVAAPGVTAPGGRAVVRIGRREVAARVVDGRLRVVLVDVPAGTRRVRVLYSGTDVVRAGRASVLVRVLR